MLSALHVQITETAQFQQEAKVEAVLVPQDLGALPVPHTEHSTATQSIPLPLRALQVKKQNNSAVTAEMAPSQRLGPGLPLISSARFAKDLGAQTAAARRLLCRGFPREGTRGPGALAKFVPPAQKLAAGSRSPLQKGPSK